MALDINVNKVWCSKHYRSIPPIVDPRAASYALVGQLLRTEEFQVLCGLDMEKGVKADSSLAQEKMDEISPVCCFIGDSGVDAALIGLKKSHKSAKNGTVNEGGK